MEIVIGIAAVSVGVKYARQRSKEAELTRAGICITCRGSGKEKCTLCYGMGSIAKPGYVNVADMANRTECKRCKGAGSFICRSCSGGGQLKRNVGASQQATAAPPVGRRQQQGSVRLPQAGPTKKAGLSGERDRAGDRGREDGVSRGDSSWDTDAGDWE